MSGATPGMRDFAERLIAYDAKEHKAAEPIAPVTFQAFEKLRPHLATLMGRAGFRALLSRALGMAGAQVQWLRAVHVKTDGSLEGLQDLNGQIGPDEFLEGAVVLLAGLLGLLVTFIGEALTLRLVLEIWPKVPLNDLDFSTGQQ